MDVAGISRSRNESTGNKATGYTREELIRLLVSQTTPGALDGQGKDSERNEEILLDIDLDGAHYLLIRLPKETRPQVRLSAREQEIVRMVAKGFVNKIIADVLNISPWTVCTHMRRIFAKLGVSSRAAMVAKILAEGGSRDQNPAEKRFGRAANLSVAPGSGSSEKATPVGGRPLARIAG